MEITAHCLVKNEDVWIWFALQSVLPFVKQVMVFDTGSTDKTVPVIQSLRNNKIILEKKGAMDAKKLVQLRQEMLDRTKTDWFLILDGDEIWPESSIKRMLSQTGKLPSNMVALFNKVRNCVGDVFHYLPEDEGDYQIANLKGNLNIRLIKKTKDMRVVGEYPLEHYQDSNGVIQNQKDNLLFVDTWYLHTTFLKRSTKDKHKASGSFGKKKIWQKGIRLEKNQLPEVLFLKRPNIVPNPLIKRGLSYELLAQVVSPLAWIKQKVK